VSSVKVSGCYRVVDDPGEIQSYRRLEGMFGLSELRWQKARVLGLSWARWIIYCLKSHEDGGGSCPYSVDRRYVEVRFGCRARSLDRKRCQRASTQVVDHSIFHPRRNRPGISRPAFHPVYTRLPRY
jgi:hypothetical protein